MKNKIKELILKYESIKKTYYNWPPMDDEDAIAADIYSDVINDLNKLLKQTNET